MQIDTIKRQRAASYRFRATYLWQSGACSRQALATQKQPLAVQKCKIRATSLLPVSDSSPEPDRRSDRLLMSEVRQSDVALEDKLA